MVSRLFYTVVCLLGLLSGLYGQQDSPIFPKTKHRFAQTSVGLYYGWTPAWDAAFNQPLGDQRFFAFAPQSSAAINLSGLHFWGKVDFWINIPLWQSPHPSEQNYRFSRGVETGVKYFLVGNPYDSPLSLFAGLSFNNIRFRYLGLDRSAQDRGIELNNTRYPLHFGLARILNNRHYLELSATWFYDNEIDYFFSRESSRRMGVPPVHFNLGYRFLFDSTVSAESDFLSGRTEQLVRALEERKKLNAFSLALGPSSAFFTRENNFNREVSPFLGQPNGARLYLDFGLGYYFHKPDAHLNLAFRNISTTSAAYGQEQRLSRRALSLDMYKFLFDYNGFVPFIGLSPSLERLQVAVSEEGRMLIDQTGEFFRMGLVVGWDIRPSRLQSFILRTNLRYFPNLSVQGENHHFHFDQLEINFIQVVFYLNRML